MNNPRYDYALSLGDTALILGHRLSEWCGHGPFLEEDIAITNIALDLVGQARGYLAYAAELEGDGRDEDQLAYLRDAPEYRNLLLVEQPNGDFGQTMIRQFFFDCYHLPLVEELSRSSDERIAGIAGKAQKEVTYHLRHSRDWVLRLGGGTEESHRRTQAAIDELWRFTGEMFVPEPALASLVESGVAVDPATLEATWRERVDATFSEAGLTAPDHAWMQKGGLRGRHTEHLGYILAEMQFLQRAYPGATW